jgi:hypothetical protein
LSWPSKKNSLHTSKNFPELKEHEGKFALVHDGDFVDIYTSYEDAIKEGYAKFGLSPFLVKQIHATEQVLFISRLVAPTPAVPTL